jgi:DNA-directed RNA polymerase I subunit RPA2
LFVKYFFYYRCNLEKLEGLELTNLGEEEYEVGGYFIVNGNEKIIRNLIETRRNFPICLQKKGFQADSSFTDKAIKLRLVGKNNKISNHLLNYKKNGEIVLNVLFKKRHVFNVIYILKCLKKTTDLEIFEKILELSEKEVDRDRVEMNLYLLYKRFDNIYSNEDILKHLGESFWELVDFPHDKMTKVEFANTLLDNFILTHLSNNEEKFDFLILCIFLITIFRYSKVIKIC